MADLDPDQLKNLADSLERLTNRSNSVSDALGKMQTERVLDSAKVRKEQADAIRSARRRGKDNDAARAAAAKVQQKYTIGIQSTMRALDNLGNMASKLGKEFYRGEVGASKYADAAAAGTDALSEFAARFGPIGYLISKVFGGIIQYFGAAAKQADKLHKGFFDLQKVGGATSRGFTDIQTSLRDFRLGIDEVDTLTRMVGENAKSLALFSGSVAKGTKAVGNMAASITNTGLLQDFFDLGIGLDEINESAFAYAALQARIGGQQRRTQDQLNKSLQEYIRETDLVTRLTGASRKEQEDARNRAMQIESFRREQELAMREGATEAEREAAKVALDTFNMLSALGPEGKKLAEGFAMTRRGFITEGPGLAMAMLSGGEAYAAAMDDSLTAAEKTQKIITIMARAADEVGGGLADVNQFSKVMGGLDYAGLKDLEKRAKNLGIDFAELLKRPDESQEDYVKRMNAMKIADLKSRDALQDFVAMGIGPATLAVKTFAETIEFVTRLLPGGADRVAAAKQAQATAAAGTAAPGAEMSNIAQKIIKAEGGAVSARNPYSSASGLGQITQGRYQDLVKQAPMGHVLKGTTFEQYQTDEGLQKEALNLQIESLRSWLASKRLSTTDAAVYLAHVFGPGGARSVLTHSDQVPVTSLFGQDIIGKNPAIFRGVATVGDLKKVISDKMGGTGYQFGGVVTGPKSGYQATLHGTEAVVPLPNGKTIPVEMSGMQVNMDRQLGILGQQLSKMDEMIAAMRDQTSVSQRILQVSQA